MRSQLEARERDLMSAAERRPRGLVRWAMRAPLPLYRYRLGPRSLGEFLLWVLYWHPHIRIAHRGRITGKPRETVVEVLRFEASTGEWLVAAMFGPGSDWYLNLLTATALEVEVRGRVFRPEQTILEPQAAQAELDRYRRAKPIWSGIVGALIRRPFTASSMPVIAFRDPR